MVHLKAFRLEVGAVILAFVAGIFVGDLASAQNWNEDDIIYKAGNDSTVVFWQCNLSATVHDKFHENDTHDIEPTDISSSNLHDCGTPEVQINDFGYGTDQPRGFYHCHEKISAQVCGEADAHINTSHPDIPEQPGETLSVVCEEIGHSVGLGHRFEGYGCMLIDNGWHLSDHDQQEINQNY